MQNGAESADFSRSELRQRIEKSAQILGLDFPQKHDSKFESKFKDDSTIGEHSVSSHATGSKSLVEALKEIKSTDSAVDYELKTKQMTFIQQKRKANKLMTISKDYEAKTGIKIKLASGKDPNPFEDDPEEKSRMELDKLLTSTSHLNAHSVADSSKSTTDEHSLTEMNSSASLDLNPLAETKHDRRSSNVKSKIMDSIKDAQSRGPRTISMIQSCRKYTAYTALDSAINKNPDNLTGEEMAEIRANRERKHKELLASLIINDKSSTGHRSSTLRKPDRSGSVLSSTIPSNTSKLSQIEEGSVTASSKTEEISKSQTLHRQGSATFSVGSLPSNDS